jgi:integrase
VSIPQKVADRLKDCLTSKGIGADQRVFAISCTAGRRVANKAGKVVGNHLRPHDLRRHAAAYASRSGVPIEIVSKVILRHANLSTTQRYLGTVSDVEAMRWIDNLYGQRSGKGGEYLKTSPLFSREIGQYHLQTVNFRAY